MLRSRGHSLACWDDIAGMLRYGAACYTVGDTDVGVQRNAIQSAWKE
jgi:hypothetical protein